MRFREKLIVASLILSICFSLPVSASSKYTDVPENHWAYSSIVSIADRGYMVGNISGEYKPNNPIDKFETSKILALAAGYKYTGATAEETAYYNNAYQVYSPLLAGYKANYTKWSANTDREISFLLQKGIYDASDIDLFIVKSGDKENLRALSRQEAAVYLTRLAGRKNDALSYTYSSYFADDSKIDGSFKPYVYYLKGQGIISGESDNNFNPNGAVTRAAMAVMLDKTLKLAVGSDAVTPVQNTSASSTDSSAALIDTVSGKIEKVHTSLSALQIKYNTGEVKIHKVEASATIFVDGYIKTIYDLTENMPIIGIVKNNNLVDIKAQSITESPIAATTPVQTPTPVTTQAAAPTNIEYRTIKGTVYNVDASSGSQSVTIEIRILSPNGGIIVERETFTAGSDCLITRGGADVAFSNLTINDVVKAKVYAGKAYVLELEEKNRRMNVVVVDKKTESSLGTNFFVVEDSKGQTHELVVNPQTALTRKGMGIIGFDDVRIGDTLDLLAEYSIIKEAYAYGVQGYTEGIINEIHTTNAGTYIILLDAIGNATKYHVISGAFDVYTLRLNSRVRLRLDSKEIEGISVLQEAKANYFTGYIDSISSKYIMLRSELATNSYTYKVYYDSATLVTDSTIGQKSSLTNLYRDMKVYVVFNNDGSDTAKSITILSK